MLDTKDLRRKYDAATPGEWHQVGDWLDADYREIHKVFGDCQVVSGIAQMRPANAAFIASAHNSYPELLDTVERLRAENAELREDLESADTANTALHSAWELLTAENERLREAKGLLEEAQSMVHALLRAWDEDYMPPDMRQEARRIAEQEATDGQL